MNNMNKSLKKIISTILVATFAFCSPLLGVRANAECFEESNEPIDTTNDVLSIESVITDDDIPECLAFEVTENNKFAARLYEKETALDTVLFANKDGSETVYIFDEDVKYIDENGSIVDKSNKLYSKAIPHN